MYNDARSNGHVEIDSTVDGHQEYFDDRTAELVILKQSCKDANINARVLSHVKIVKPKVCFVFI